MSSPYRVLIAVLLLAFFPQVQALSQDETLEDRIDAAFNAGELAGLHSILVIHNGEKLAERHYPGEDQNWGRPLGPIEHSSDQLHDLRSVTKSIVGLLYGIALNEGLVPAPEEPLIAQFDDYADLATDPKRQAILVDHALSMRMGTEWNEDLPYTDARNSEIAMEQADDRYRFILDRPMVQQPGETWVYNGGATAIVAKLIAEGAQRPIDVYAKEKLFDPLGIDTFEWASGSDGVPSAASGLRLTAPDLAKIGQLVLNKGQWNGQQIVPAVWLETSLTPRAQNDIGLRYGYQWWMAPEGDPPIWVSGFGNGGQRLWIAPKGKLIVIIFAGNYNKQDQWQLPLKIITEFVLPAVRKR